VIKTVRKKNFRFHKNLSTQAINNYLNALLFIFQLLFPVKLIPFLKYVINPIFYTNLLLRSSYFSSPFLLRKTV
jgi:hypothetical protein